jgi:PAS domain S-box-containing protein
MELDFQKDPTVLGTVMDSMAAGLFTVDADGVFVAWSAGAERITGYSQVEVVGQPCNILQRSGRAELQGIRHPQGHAR